MKGLGLDDGLSSSLTDSQECAGRAMGSALPAGWMPAKKAEGLKDITELASCIAPHLNHGRNASCRVVGFRRKGRKILIEFELTTEDDGDLCLRRCIGKVYKDDRGRQIFDAQSQLWASGFRPPSLFTVVCPIAYVADRFLLLQEKAAGRPLAEILFSDPANATATLVPIARWLSALHNAAVRVESRLEQVKAAIGRYGRELAELLPRHARQIERLTGQALAGLETAHLAPLVPSHGDLHPKNIFVAPDGRVTAIDLDTLGSQERVADMAYFLAQTAIMGYFHRGSFAATASARYCFLRAYQDAVSSPWLLTRPRLALYIGISFLQSLHYELWVLRNGRTAIIQPWLANATRCLLHGEVTLLDDA